MNVWMNRSCGHSRHAGAAAGPARTKPPQRSIPNFTYSPAMQNVHKGWDEAQLDVYITDPRAVVPGTKMISPGLKSETDCQNVIPILPP